MKIIIYGIFILLTLYLGRKYLKGFVLDYFEKRKKKIDHKPVNKDFIYAPIINTRTFELTIEVTDTGDGQATISVLKSKK